VEKTTLTISGVNAYVEALLKDARVSGRTLLALRAEPDPRRNSGQADVRAGTQPATEAVLSDIVVDTQTGPQVEWYPSPEDTGSGVQEEPDATLQGNLESEDQILSVEEAAEETATAPEVERTVINWNPGSFASTKAALIEAETALLGTVNEAIVFIDPSCGGRRLSDLTLGQIEAACTTWITGYAQLLRELGRRFAERGSGLILVVLLPGERGPLGAMATGAIEALACSLASQTGEAYRFFALRDESGQPELLARYIMKILDEPPRDSSKLLRHGGRLSLFGK
jgi:hypothetical protein